LPPGKVGKGDLVAVGVGVGAVAGVLAGAADVGEPAVDEGSGVDWSVA
jgi:hypothetical protein